MKRFRKAFMSVLAMGAALCCGSLFADAPVEYTGPNNGDWFEPSNWSGSEVPGESDAVVIGKQVTVNLAGAVKVASLTLSNKATLHVTANSLADVSVFDPAKYDTEQARRDAVAAALWEERTIVEVTGDFIVDAGCTVQPENDKITGTPVVFKVGSASIAGTINATGLGWGWGVLSEDSEQMPGDAPAGALTQHCNDPKTFWVYSYAFGSGSYANSGTVGGLFKDILHGGTTAQDKSLVYGYPCAPFLPGSPSQMYSYVYGMRGGGSIIIHAATTVSVTGSLLADGNRKPSGYNPEGGQQNDGCSGGGVWLAAPEIAVDDAATIEANGDKDGQGKGGGGRIALTYVASEAELVTLASGEIPSNMTVSDYVNSKVTATSPKPENNGTVKLALSGNLQATLTTQSNVDGLIAAGVTWGDEVLMNGDYERTAPQYAYLAEDATIRYTCQGYVVSNKNGQVSSSDVDLTANFTIDGSLGPYSLTWKWGDRTEIDPEPVSRHWVGGSSESLVDPNNWEPAGVPTRVDELYITNAAVSASRIQVAKLLLSGGSLTVGSSTTREAIGFSVTGDVMVCDGATLNVYAPLKTDPAGYTSVADARLLLWQNRTKVSIGGAFTVAAGSTVKVSNHPETGDLVVFEVGSFDLEAGGTVTAEGAGFTWFLAAGKTLPEGTIRVDSDVQPEVPYYTYGFGSAVHWLKGGYSESGGHGNSSHRPYGLDFAPFEPGSPGEVSKSNGISYGGGSIVILAKGAVTLAGTLNADGVLGSSLAGPSGGSIWIAGDTIAYGDGLVATARGVAFDWNAYGAGDGGRIAFMTDVTTMEQVETMVGGTKLEGFTYTALTQAGVSVDGGRRKPTDEQPAGKVGTAVSAFSLASYEPVTITASPLEAISAKAGYGEYQFRGGETVEREADVIGGDPVDPQNVRYVCTGYVVSNATEQVAEGKTTTLSFPVVKGAGPYKVVWLWDVRQTRSQLSVTGPGTATVNGQTVSELWIPDTEDAVFAATPDAGKAFWTWSGTDVPAASVAETSIALPATTPHVVRAVFADLTAAAKICTFKTTASGDFYDPANWEDALVPNPQDAAVIPGGACTALGRVACGSLTMTGGSLSIEDAEEVAIPGDVALSGDSVWTIMSVPTNGTATAYADGATRVAIGGNLVLADTATVRPVSEPWTGGSVTFGVAGSFTLGEAAKFDAVGAGWSWVEYTGERCPLAVDWATASGRTVQTMATGRGRDYRAGASHGGLGGNQTDENLKYGSDNAPVLPGSPSGVNGDGKGGWYCYLGGGLVRIHVIGKATVAGTLDASAPETTNGGSSGGGIWFTAGKFVFAPTAVLRAAGGDSSAKGSHTFNSMGGGGRIAIGTGLTAAQISQLAQTGECGRRVRGEDEFRIDFPDVTVPDVSGGTDRNSGNKGGSGTFSYYPAPKGLAVFVK